MTKHFTDELGTLSIFREETTMADDDNVIKRKSTQGV